MFLVILPYGTIKSWYNQVDQTHNKIDGLVQQRHNSITYALELGLSCTKPSIWSLKLKQKIVMSSLAAQEGPLSISDKMSTKIKIFWLSVSHFRCGLTFRECQLPTFEDILNNFEWCHVLSGYTQLTTCIFQEFCAMVSMAGTSNYIDRYSGM